MNADDALWVLAKHGFNRVTFRETQVSAVTTAWNVDWDEVFIARDLMQNFFDSCQNGDVEQIQVRTWGEASIITAPVAYNLQRLYFLGSEKTDDQVGKYGEGFKAATTCLVRDHNAVVIAASGTDVLVIGQSDTTIKDTKLVPLVYHFYDNAEPVDGNMLLVTPASAKLKHAIQHGLQNFLYPGNELVGELLANKGNDFEVYQSRTEDGYIFYRRLLRAVIPKLPVILVLNKPFADIEKKIKHDRDRVAFGEPLLDAFYAVWSRSFFERSFERQQVIVRVAAPLWRDGKGHPLLESAAGKYYFHAWPARLSEEVFGKGYYARSLKEQDDALLSTQYHILETAWKTEGRVELPRYFQAFGVISAEVEARRMKEQALVEAKQKGEVRLPTTAEQRALRLLERFIREVTPDLGLLIQKDHITYTIAMTESLLGELRGQSYRASEVFLAESEFDGSFGHGVAVYLHEIAHGRYGYDGQRTFSDALTRLIEQVIDQHESLRTYEESWEEIRIEIDRERQRTVTDDFSPDIINTLDLDALRTLIRRVPASVLRAAYLKKEPDDSAPLELD